MNFLGNKTFFIVMLTVFIIVAGVNYFVGAKLMPVEGYVITYIALAVITIWYLTTRKTGN